MKKHRHHLQALLATLTLTITLIPQLITGAEGQMTSSQAFTDPLDSYNTRLWHKADGWTNGDPFACGFRADHIAFSGSVMTLLLDDAGCPGGCSGAAYASGEYRSNGFYQYGSYTVEMKAAASEGIVSSFFIYTDSSDGNPHDEIDIEILGKDPIKLQVNYFTDGIGGHEADIDLGFDASADFHTYTIKWMPNSIKWSVDGILVHAADSSSGALPSSPGRIMMNFWPGTDTVNSWLGEFSYSAPLQAQYSLVSFEPAAWLNKNYLPLISK
jgi:endo-1,3-1,4-beta-glycanase ExoK